MFDHIVDILEDFRDDVRSSHIEYFIRCKRKRHSCLVVVILTNPNTKKIVLDLKLKVREWIEISTKLEDLLSFCRQFAVGRRLSGSPEY